MSSRMRFATRSLSVKSVPKCSLNVLRMLLSRSSSSPPLCPPPGTAEFLSPRAREGQRLQRGYGVLRTGKAAPHLRFVKAGLALVEGELADTGPLTVI